MQNIGAQGELRIYKINELPSDIGVNRPKKDKHGRFILAHSEKGHHHVLGGDVDVIEHVKSVQFGKQSYSMRILYAIVNSPTAIIQTAPDCHQEIQLDEGLFFIRADNEYNPWADELREVKD
jgi:hypothetical protein